MGAQVDPSVDRTPCLASALRAGLAGPQSRGQLNALKPPDGRPNHNGTKHRCVHDGGDPEVVTSDVMIEFCVRNKLLVNSASPTGVAGFGGPGGAQPVLKR